MKTIIKFPKMGKGVVRSAQALVAAMLLAMPLLFTACSETNETQEEYPDWKNKNQTFWNKLYTETRRHATVGYTSWKLFKTYTKQDSISGVNTDYIIVHVKQAGTGSGTPFSTDSVSVRYTGQLLPSTSYPAGYIFDTTSPAGTTDATAGVAHMAINSLTDGFATALQHMHIGDKWDVYVPWTLAYGAKGNKSIPGYSVLKFEISLLAYARAGSALPKFHVRAVR
jgi:FKBP-type peptidyl-prolyl cis-trans isomerases 1